MSEFTRETTKTVIEDNKRAIKSNHPKIALKNNPNLLEEEQKLSEMMIEDTINELANQYNELVPFIKRLRDYVSDITEETHFCAVYLLLCQATVHLESLFLLAKNGSSSTMMLTVRPIKEAFALAKLFSFEFANMEDKYLKKWFSGEVVLHGVYRKKIKEFFKDMTKEEIAYLENTSTDLYRMESLIIHSAYTSVIECISPFTEDFDFGKFTKFRRAARNLGYVIGAMDGACISLKFVYKFLLKDLDSYDQLEKILVSHTR